MRLTILGAAILVLGLAGWQGRIARGADTLSNELRELDQMRNGKRTLVDKVELRGKELLREHASPEEQGQIYYHLADINGQSGMVHPELVIEYAQHALTFPIEPAQRLRLFTYWGDALMIGNQHTAIESRKPFPEIRKMAAVPYLEGLKEAAKYKIPLQKPELPAVDLYDVPETAPIYQQVKKRHDEQMLAHNRARIEQELWDHRRVLTGQIVQIYSRKPYANEELRELAVKTTNAPELADQLVAMVDRSINGIKESEIPSSGENKEKTNPKPAKMERDRAPNKSPIAVSAEGLSLSIQIKHADANPKDAEIRHLDVARLAPQNDKSVLHVNKVVPVVIALTNMSQDKCIFVETDTEANFHLEVLDSKGNKVPRTLYGKQLLQREINTRKYIARVVTRTISPGDSLQYEFNLSRQYDLSLVGAYSVQASCEVPRKRADLKSNVIVFELQ